MRCSIRNYGWIGLKPARCQESAARTGFVNPLSRRDAADGRFQANPTGGGQGAVGFVARRQCMFPYTFLLPSRPQPLGPPSTHNYGWIRALRRSKNGGGVAQNRVKSTRSAPGLRTWLTTANKNVCTTKKATGPSVNGYENPWSFYARRRARFRIRTSATRMR